MSALEVGRGAQRQSLSNNPACTARRRAPEKSFCSRNKRTTRTRTHTHRKNAHAPDTITRKNKARCWLFVHQPNTLRLCGLSADCLRAACAPPASRLRAACEPPANAATSRDGQTHGTHVAKRRRDRTVVVSSCLSRCELLLREHSTEITRFCGTSKKDQTDGQGASVQLQNDSAVHAAAKTNWFPWKTSRSDGKTIHTSTHMLVHALCVCVVCGGHSFVRSFVRLFVWLSLAKSHPHGDGR